jgi:hypothetical protein
MIRMEESYTSHAKYQRNICFDVMLHYLWVLQNYIDSLLLVFIQLGFLQDGILLYKLQYFCMSIYVDMN